MEGANCGIGAYCTLRMESKKPSDKVKGNYKHYCTLRGHNHSNPSSFPESNIPYSQLEESRSSDNCTSCTIDVDNDESSTATECDLIDLGDVINLKEIDQLNQDIGGTTCNNYCLKKVDLELNQNKIEQSNYSIDGTNDKLELHHNSKLLSNTLPKNRDDQQLAMREFNRLNSYCTLRPDQKRKYLLQTITQIRHSKHLSEEANHALLLINELDSLDTHMAARMSSEIPNLNFDDPEKIEECLMELDAYLEEIDRNYMCSETKENSLEYSMHENIDVTQQSITNSDEEEIAVIASTSGNNCVYSDFSRRLSDCESDDNYNARSVVDQCDLFFNQNNELNLIVNLPDIGDDGISRQQPFRNTIGGAGDSTFPRRNILQKDAIGTNRRHSTWRRNSMRKTRPITLPEHPNTPTVTNPLKPQNVATHSQSDNNRNPILNDFSNLNNQSNHTQSLIPSVECTDNLNVPSAVNQIVQSTNSQPIPRPNNDAISYESENYENERSGISNSRTLLENEYLNAFTEMADNDSTINSTLNRSNSHFYTDENSQSLTRPRQIGRRAEGRVRVVSITTETNSLGNPRIIVNHDTSSSSTPIRAASTRSPNDYVASEQSSAVSSRNTSPVSIESSSASSLTTSAVNSSVRLQQRTSTDPESPSSDEQDNTEQSKIWPCAISRILAGTCCTLGLFNISRFSIFSIHFGANFIVQFLILSFIFGIPMLWLQMCLGARLKSGPISMWRISPICKGIGISLIVIQSLIALYSAVSIAWILVYLRDSFLSQNSKYRWQEPFEIFRGPRTNESIKLSETVADYFNGIVLQRYQLGPGGRAGITGIGAVRFQLAFNLAILWIAVFVVLCKGLQSYSKSVIGLMILPLVGLVALCTKILTMIDSNSLQNIFPSTDWQDFFLNSQSWLSAAQEVFLTWALFGASIISIFSKPSNLQEKNTALRRDALIIILITLLGLLLAALLGNACVQILNDHGYYYFPGSYENYNSYIFLLPSNSPLPPQLATTPTKWIPRYSTVLGEGYSRTSIPNRDSGFQAIRLVTELFPATLAVTSSQHISSAWSILGFSLFLLFGVGQLCAMWKPIASALGKSTSAVLLSCVTGLLLAIPLATECGINIIHFFDIIIGGSWCVLLLWVGQIFAVFLVRGRPYSGDLLVNDLFLTQTLSAFVALSWNVLLPIGLLTLCIIEYNHSNARDLYHWRGTTYWPMWVRKVGGFVQINLLLIVPITSIVQIYRYLSKGPPDILDRVQMLYRPSLLPPTPNRNSPSRNERPCAHPLPATISLEPQATNDDAPPKYTPPPSYTTATGARIAKMLRNSIRRSVRRLLGESSNNCRQRPCLQNTSNTSHLVDTSLPPAYSTVLVDPAGDASNSQYEMGPRVLYNSQTHRNHTLEMQRRTTSTERNTTRAQTLTARDVAQLLRPSKLQFQRASSLGACVDQTIRDSLQKGLSRSAENLVLNEVSPGESSAIAVILNDDRKTSVI